MTKLDPSSKSRPISAKFGPWGGGARAVLERLCGNVVHTHSTPCPDRRPAPLLGSSSLRPRSDAAASSTCRTACAHSGPTLRAKPRWVVQCRTGGRAPTPRPPPQRPPTTPSAGHSAHPWVCGGPAARGGVRVHGHEARRPRRHHKASPAGAGRWTGVTTTAAGPFAVVAQTHRLPYIGASQQRDNFALHTQHPTPPEDERGARRTVSRQKFSWLVTKRCACAANGVEHTTERYAC